MGLLWKGNSEWWRIRVHGMMLMLIWLILPNSLPGLFVTLTVSATGFVELIDINNLENQCLLDMG